MTTKSKDDLPVEEEVELPELSEEAELEVLVGDAEPEVEIFERSNEKITDPTQLYLNEIGFSPLLTAEEEVHFGRLALQGNEAARHRMIESNLRLVVKFHGDIYIAVLIF